MPQPFVPFVRTVQVAMRYTQQGQQVENVFHCQLPAAPTETSMRTVAETFKTWWNTNMKPLVSGNVKLVEILVTDLTTVTGIGITYTEGLPIQGTNSGNDLPMNATVAVKWTTLLRGRSFRGRTYHVGLLIEQVDASILKPATVTSFTAAYVALITALNTALTGLVVASRRSANAWRALGVSTFVAYAVVEPTVDSQRRRLPGRGR